MATTKAEQAFDTVTVSEVIPAPVAAVWRAWTLPEEKMTWWGRSENLKLVLCEMDVRVGGRYRYGMAADGDTEVSEAAHGCYRVVEEEKRLVYTWSWGGEEPSVRDTLVTVIFERVDANATRVTVTHERQPTKRVATIHTEGWTHMLADLVLHVENGPGEH
ncbi:SRPBCC family protein [Hoeflea prorocentri]|uniref:SRPBCC domain-containing protein n=1 Tax=Hoeflea prorocentri TaxID=1922333 RepID=A0A9X3ULY6_9HYPH|nr:SRPBCC domain-containing protein [Hoeflea prorocentri]MCY6383672.1 SRPBCC domain-containing protein [Hoeflea prorocentri]MDA5401472.1 SRPBCC domain-containing protein [Hoeflea prorocentri]